MTIDQLRHRREHLPARVTLSDAQAAAGAVRVRYEAAAAARDEAASRQAAIEGEVESTQRRIAEINARLYGSSTVSPKDAQAMSVEVTHLKERQNGLEDDELVVMEELEPLQSTVDALHVDAQELARQVAAAQQQLTADISAVENEIVEQVTQRSAAEAAAPASLLAQYEKLRSQLGGIAVAPLNGSSCGGCHLTLSSAELSRIHKAPEDAIVSCEECGRILVRPQL